jgi:carbon storage regulator
MLVLSRKKGERIVISDNIIVEVVEINKHSVRLGFTAPKEVTINRHEVHEIVSRDTHEEEK